MKINLYRQLCLYSRCLWNYIKKRKKVEGLNIGFYFEKKKSFVNFNFILLSHVLGRCISRILFSGILLLLFMENVDISRILFSVILFSSNLKCCYLSPFERKESASAFKKKLFKFLKIYWYDSSQLTSVWIVGGKIQLKNFKRIFFTKC